MNALMHVTDWLPTLVSIAGFEVNESMSIDGYDQSSNIRDGVENIYWVCDIRRHCVWVELLEYFISIYSTLFLFQCLISQEKKSYTIFCLKELVIH